MKRIYLGGLAIVFLGLFLTTQSAHASCAQITDQEKYDRSELVAIGQISLRISDNQTLFKFTKIFKNISPSRYNSVYIFNGSTIDTPDDVQWKTDQSYLMYLQVPAADSNNQNSGYYYTTTCDGTREFNNDFTSSELSVFAARATTLPLPPEPGSDIPKTNTSKIASPATSFSIEMLDEYGSYTDYDYSYAVVSISYLVLIIVVGFLLVMLTIKAGRASPIVEGGRSYTKWLAWLVFLITAAVFMLLFRPFHLQFSSAVQPLYTLFTPAALAIGCANPGMTANNIINLFGFLWMFVLLVITLWYLIAPTAVHKHPRALIILIVLYTFAAFFPLLSIILQRTLGSGC